MPRTLVVHYAEIGTKGNNRAQFERRLMAHLGMALGDVGIRASVKRAPGRLTVDLPSQTVTTADGQVFGFEIDPFRKHCLLNGLDDIGLTLEKSSAIDIFEKNNATLHPWA